MSGSSVDQYDAPLFVAWQLTNRCASRCLTCCEESGPEATWNDELTRTEALELADRIVADGVPYVAFGGGEPLGVPHFWDILTRLSAGGVAVKLETTGATSMTRRPTGWCASPSNASRYRSMARRATTHERLRPGSSFDNTIAAIQRLVARGQPPQLVFVPNLINIQETVAAYELARQLDCEAFVTGPMMRIGRAAVNWDHLACSDADWENAVHALREHSPRARHPDAVVRLPLGHRD